MLSNLLLNSDKVIDRLSTVNGNPLLSINGLPSLV